MDELTPNLSYLSPPNQTAFKIKALYTIHNQCARAAASLGSTLVVIVGGWTLLEYGFRYIGALIVGLNIIAFIVFRLMVKDPIKNL